MLDRRLSCFGSPPSGSLIGYIPSPWNQFRARLKVLSHSFKYLRPLTRMISGKTRRVYIYVQPY